MYNWGRMRRVGVHTSIAGGLSRSLERAHVLGCTTVQLFSHSPRGWAVKAIPNEERERFASLRRDLDISPVYIHASYLINMASPEAALRKKSIAMLREEMDRADAIGADYVVLHTGSASGDDAAVSRRRAIGALNEVARSGRWAAGLLLENTAGERGDISSRVADLAEIFHGVGGTLVAGVCIDTCHAFSAGYDIRRDDGIRAVAEEIDHAIGLERVRLIHLNDAKGDLRSGADRHEHIGLGRIGTAGLRRFVLAAPFRRVPLILETPKERETDDARNLRAVRKMLFGEQ